MKNVQIFATRWNRTSKTPFLSLVDQCESIHACQPTKKIVFEKKNFLVKKNIWSSSPSHPSQKEILGKSTCAESSEILGNPQYPHLYLPKMGTWGILGNPRKSAEFRSYRCLAKVALRRPYFAGPGQYLAKKNGGKDAQRVQEHGHIIFIGYRGVTKKF